MIKITVSKKSYCIDNDQIDSICLFGSTARGDTDSLSDVDLFFLIEDCDEETFIHTKKKIASDLNMPTHWLSVYRKSTIDTMFEFGSYFLWHLKIEGIMLFSRTGFLEQKLFALPAYTKVEEDLKEYKTICQDIRESISQDTLTFAYELAVIASLIRNTCIALTYLHGKYLFGRISPVEYAKEVIGEEFPFSINEYQQLYRYRIIHSRAEVNLSLPIPTPIIIEKWLNAVEQLIGITIKYKEGEW